jgi:hypothetical protein
MSDPWHCVEFAEDEDDADDPDAIARDLGHWESVDEFIEAMGPGCYGIRRREGEPWIFVDVPDPEDDFIVMGPIDETYN